MRVSMDQLTVEDPDAPHDATSASEAPAAVEQPVLSDGRPAQPKQPASAVHSISSIQPAQVDKIAADDWGEFTGDGPAE